MVHFSNSDRQAGLPADYRFTIGSDFINDNGVHTFTVTLKTAGAQTVTATDTALGFIAGSAAVTVAPAAASRFDVAAPATRLAGMALPLTVTAYDAYGNVATGYTGTVHLASDDGQAVLPADYAFTTGAGGDNGAHTFNVTLRTAGRRAVTVSDTTASPVGTATITVTPAAATSFQLSGFPSPTTAGVEGTFTVTALDPFGNVDTGYRGTIHLTSSDPQAVLAVLEGDYRFLPSDNGVHTFRATLNTAGSQSITATDVQSPGITGSQTDILVTPAASGQPRGGTPAAATPGGSSGAPLTAPGPSGHGGVQRDQVNLDLFWLRDKSLDGPDVLAQEITDDMQTALEQFSAIAEKLKR
jgi:hypothetical protein